MSVKVFVELELRGPSDRAVAFVEGVRLATRYPGQVWYSGREGVRSADLLDTLLRKFQRCTHVILSTELAARIRQALELSVDLDLRVESERPIDHAELGFDFHCYSTEEVQEVRRLIEKDLPEGVSLEGYTVDEQVDEDARGAEFYSPAHHYEAEGKGRYVGSVGGIIDMAHRLADQSFIHPESIDLRYPE